MGGGGCENWGEYTSKSKGKTNTSLQIFSRSRKKKHSARKEGPGQDEGSKVWERGRGTRKAKEHVLIM